MPNPQAPFLLAALLAAPLLAGCLIGPEPADVLATFYPVRYLADQIAGDQVSVGQLVPGSQEPHDWEPSVGDVERLRAARIVLAQSPEFEPWLGRLVANLGSDAPQVVYTARLLEVHDDGHDGEGAVDAAEEEDHDAHEDPHTWLDPLRYAEQAEAARDGLLAAFPEHAQLLQANAAALNVTIRSVHDAYATRLVDCRTIHFVTQHAAFGLLAERYGLVLHSVQGLAPEAGTNPATLEAVIQVVREHRLPIVFTEPGANPHIMAAVAAETGATVRSLDPIETVTGKPWDERMRGNLEHLAAALECA